MSAPAWLEGLGVLLSFIFLWLILGWMVITWNTTEMK